MTTRYARRIDGNQPAIVRTLRAMGCQVCVLSAHGHDVPDLAVCGGPIGAEVWMVEIKNPENKSRTGQLSQGQKKWMETWVGPTTVLRSVDDARAWALGKPRGRGGKA